MTIAVSLKVNDGLVPAADSASTIMSAYGVENVYNNANKVFNLRKGLPVGLITWGLGGLAGLSISTLAKDLRVRFAGEDIDHRDWHLDAASYTLEDVASQVREFFYEEHYRAASAGYVPTEDDGPYPPLGFIVAGYSAGAHQTQPGGNMNSEPQLVSSHAVGRSRPTGVFRCSRCHPSCTRPLSMAP